MQPSDITVTSCSSGRFPRVVKRDVKTREFGAGILGRCSLLGTITYPKVCLKIDVHFPKVGYVIVPRKVMKGLDSLVIIISG